MKEYEEYFFYFALQVFHFIFLTLITVPKVKWRGLLFNHTAHDIWVYILSLGKSVAGIMQCRQRNPKIASLYILVDKQHCSWCYFLTFEHYVFWRSSQSLKPLENKSARTLSTWLADSLVCWNRGRKKKGNIIAVALDLSTDKNTWKKWTEKWNKKKLCKLSCSYKTIITVEWYVTFSVVL